MADYSDDITTGGASQLAATNRNDRSSLTFQNNSAETMWLKFGAAAVPDTGYKVAAGGQIVFERKKEPKLTQKLYVIAATTGSKYTANDDAFDMP